MPVVNLKKLLTYPRHISCVIHMELWHSISKTFISGLQGFCAYKLYYIMILTCDVLTLVPIQDTETIFILVLGLLCRTNRWTDKWTEGSR